MSCWVRILVLSQSLCALLAIHNPDGEISDWCGDHESCEVQSAGVEHVLLQKTQTRDVAGSHANSETDTPRLKASSVPISEEGYNMILKLRNEQEMSEFIKRAASELGFEITEEAKLNGVVPYYSGKKAAQSFAALKSELDNTSKGPKGWARIPGKKAKRASSFTGSGQSLLQFSQQVVESHSKAVDHRMNTSVEAPMKMKAAEVSLNEEGYKAIAKMRNEQEMTVFVRRVAEENGYEIADIGSLHGVVPYYSGKKATQSFVALRDELSRTSKDPHGWARKPKKKQGVHADLMEMQAKDSGVQKVKARGERAGKQRSVESPPKSESKNIPKRKVKLANIRRKNNRQQATSPKKSANKRRHDAMPNAVHSDKQHHDNKKSQVRSKAGRKDSTSASEHAKHVEKNVHSEVAGKKRNKASMNKRHAARSNDAEKAKNDLASTEASELDETMLAAAVKGKMHARVEPTHEDTIKKKDVSALHVVGQVKVEAAVPPTKIHP